MLCKSHGNPTELVGDKEYDDGFADEVQGADQGSAACCEAEQFNDDNEHGQFSCCRIALTTSGRNNSFLSWFMGFPCVPLLG